MSLLDKASLIVTPNAYKESKLYSVVPNTTLGDMDVVRATTATRVNSAGLIEVVPRNLFVYSNDFTTANWTKENSSITTSQIGYDGTNNASLLVENSTTNNHFIRQTPSLSGQTTISVYAKANTRNWLYLRGVQSGVPVFGFFNLTNGTLGTIQTNGTGSITSVGNGWYRCSLTVANFNTGFEVYIGLSNADNVTSYLGNGSSIFIQNSQVESFATASNYFPTTTRVNIPRIDYTNGSCPSLLVEPQRTNLFTYSEQFDNIIWLKQNATVTSNSIVSPSGVSNADSLIASNGTANFKGLYAVQINAAPKSFSFFAKKGNKDWAILLGYSGANNCWFNVSNGTIGTVGSNYINAKIENYGNGWYRCSATLNTLITETNLGIYVSNSDNSTSCTGDGTTASLYIWGAQCESGSYPTSYIPTVASSVTRNADVISKTGISSLIGQTEGTLFYDGIVNNIQNTFSNILNTNKNNATLSTFALIKLKATDKLRFDYFLGNGTSTSIQLLSTNSFANGIRTKVAIRYKSGDFAMYVNGILQATSSLTYTNNGTKTELFLNDPTTFFAFQESVSYNSVQLYKTPLTDTELQSLTTL